MPHPTWLRRLALAGGSGSSWMNKHRPWLFAEIDRWTKDGVITAEQGAAIRRLYPPPAGAPWGLILFCSVGAVVVGLGVVLLFAYNWHAIPKAGKLTLVFGSLIAAHAAGLKLATFTDWRVRLGEALSILGTMLFGAAIWLIAQIYHIDEHFPNGFMFWGLGALALAWALQSIPQAILAVATLTIWGGSEAFAFDQPSDWAVVALLCGVAPLAVRRGSALLFSVLLAALYFLVVVNASQWAGSGGGFTVALALAVFLIGSARLAETSNNARLPYRVFAFFGYGALFICVFILTFRHSVQHLLRWGGDSETGLVRLAYLWALFVAAAAVWGRLSWGVLRRGERLPLGDWLCPVALVYGQALAVTGFYGDAFFVSGVFNVIFLALAVTWMLQGCRDGSLRITVLGSVAFTVWIWARYFDLFDSLAARGFAFLLLGGVLFAEGIFYRKLRRKEERT